LQDAYRRCIFPWYSPGQPILWWSPDPRMVLFVDEFKVGRSLRKTVARNTFEIRIDTDFAAVLEGCAAPRGPDMGTWITREMVDAYVRLHECGIAHSFEAWRDNRLVGGLYGLCIGQMFYGESMFAREPDASKVALVHLVRRLEQFGLPMIDCQQETAHLARFGARPIARGLFAKHVQRLVHSPQPTRLWSAELHSETFAP
jgi:leucyl/phenylalanyl-tRNA--protein transferase